ncbi:MAG: type II secretion system protein GspJ [Terrimicrobiaceae bacterium]|nr:type II secretion system protein GspJ [Terrimicrobiaceae bacterium]
MKAATRQPGAFTLLETILAIALFALLAGALYAVANAALDATRIALEEQAANERLDAFLRATRRAFASLPADGTVALRFDTSAGAAAAAPEIVFTGAGTFFGVPLAGGGELILAAPAMADGTRTFSLARIPPAASELEAAAARKPSAQWPLLPGVGRVEWAFFSNGQWREEWPDGSGRPELVRLRFSRRQAPDDLTEAVFWVPPLRASPAQEAPTQQDSLIPPREPAS